MKVFFNQWFWSCVVVALLAYSYFAIQRDLVASYSLQLNASPTTTAVLSAGSEYQVVVINKLKASMGGAEIEVDGMRYLDNKGQWLNHDWFKIDDEARTPDIIEPDIFRYTYTVTGAGAPLKLSFSSFNTQMVSGEVVVGLYKR